MKKTLLIFLFPLFMFSQQMTLIGDVDCSGEVNSEDASLILQYVTSVIDSLPCSENMSGLTPDQLQEIVEMMDSQLTINYGGMSFGDWVLKYDNPSFDNFLYGQEETDGFLLVQYSRANQITSSAAFGFNIHTGTDIDTVNFNMDVSINIHTSWNPVNSKTIPIKKGDYWVLENIDNLFPTEVGIDKVYFLPINGEASVSDSSSSGGGNATVSNKSVEFPDGCCGEPVSWSLENFGSYTVPDGKNLYITQYHNTQASGGLFITGADADGNYEQQRQIIKGNSNYVYYTGVGFSPSNTNGMPIIVGGGDLVSGDGSFNGFIIDAIVTPFTIADNGFCYSENQDVCYMYQNDVNENVFILQFYGDDSGSLGVVSNQLFLQGQPAVIDYYNYVPIIENYSNNIFYTGVGYTPAMTLSSPIMVGPNQQIWGKGLINGYITPLNYFSE